MILFLQNILSFPVVIYSALLVIVVFYWITTAFGLLDIDVLDIDAPDMDIDGELPDGALNALLIKFKLNGVPLTLTITLIILFGWLISYYSQYFILSLFDAALIRYALGSLIFLAALAGALLLTALIIKPLSPLFKKLNREVSAHSLEGRSVEIRSTVNSQRGEAIFEDGGAGMLLQVRAEEGVSFSRGERAVIIKYHPESHTYSVITEDEFKGL